MSSKGNPQIELKVADRIEITTLIDNYSDSLLARSEPESEIVRRASTIVKGEISSDALLAEHGLCLLLRVFKGAESHSLLLDAGHSKIGVPHNLKMLEIDISEIEAILLSHGHMDHFGSLIEILKASGKTVPVVVHPDAFLPRYREQPEGERIRFPLLNEMAVREAGGEIIKTKSPFLFASALATSLGEIERITDFESPMPGALTERLIEREGNMEPDLILDDQGIAMNLEEKGLVIITGCAHAGVINTIRHTQRITGVESIYAVLGGFHLTGPQFRETTKRTIEELKKVNPAIIIPMHCTCWAAINQIAEEMPDQFKLNSVGTTFCF